MSLDSIQQLENILQRSHDVVIFIPENISGDGIGAAWAFAFFLKKRNINATVVAALDNGKKEKYAFLAQPENVSASLSGARDFVLSFNTEHNKIIDVRTEIEEEEVRIFITPEKGAIDPRDFSFIPARFKYDLAIVLDCPDKETIGKVYEENPDIFYEVPVVNIDHHTENDNFGQINIVDITAGATTEVVTEILEKLDSDAIDEKIAQCLLLGIIDATNSFQKKNTTPKSLHSAAMLMTKGADQQKIIRFLYKTQPFHLLKLWGRIMAKLNWEEDLKLVWAPVFLEDFVQSRSSEKDIQFILEKIKENYSTGKLFMLLYIESSDKVRGVIKGIDGEQMKNVSLLLEAKANGDVFEFSENSNDIVLAGKKIVEKLYLLKN